MSTQSINELQEFYRFIADKLSNGGGDLSPEDALDEWRNVHPDPLEFEDDVTAIQQALDDVANGDKGMPFEDFDREFRKQHNLPVQP